jgi:subtilisin family serine protease
VRPPLNSSSSVSRPGRRSRRGAGSSRIVLVAVAATLLVVSAGPAGANGSTSTSTSATPAGVFGGAAKVPAQAYSQAASHGRVAVIVSLAQGTTSLASTAGKTPAEVATAHQVGDSVAQALPKGSAAGTRTLSQLGMLTTSVDAKGLAALANSPDVASVAVSQWRKPDLAPEANLINAPYAWNFGTGYNGAGQAVGILDTGVQTDHPFLGGRVVDGACFTAGGFTGDPNAPGACTGSDSTTAPAAARVTPSTPGAAADGVPCTSVPGECLHGTHVAGIAAGGTGSTSGNGSGVAWGANIVAVQVFTTLLSTAYCGGPAPCIEAADVDVIAGLDFLLAHRSSDHIVAANMSLGAGNSVTACDSSLDDAAYHAAFATAVADDVAPVVAAGNGYGQTSGPNSFPNGLSFPACDSNAVSVGAVTDASQWVQGGACPFSLNPCSFSQDSPQLSMVAPGWNVLSSIPGSSSPPGSFTGLYGTSMATPFITGAFAVIRQEHPTWAVADVEALLRGTGIPIKDPRPGALGEATPLLNLGAAVNPPTFHAITPGRLLDTRNSAGLPNVGTRLGAGSTVNIAVNAFGVPGGGVSAVVLNVTAVNPVGNGFVTAWPAGMPRPGTSNLNLTPGVIKPNLVTVKVGADNQVSLYNQTGSVDLVVDIDGWYDLGGAANSGGTLHAVTPQRVLDTRFGTGLPGGVAAQAGPSSVIHLPVKTLASLPAGATAVVLNLTSVNVSAPSFITTWPGGSNQPTASSLNPAEGSIDSNLVVVPIGADGNVNLFNAFGHLDLVADLAGWFDSTPAPTSGHLVPLSPARLLDTRSGLGISGVHPVGPSGSISLQVTGRGGVPGAGVSAVVLNVTAVNTTVDTFITAWPTGGGRPLASNLNPIAGRITSNLVTVPVGSGGQVNLYNLTGNTDLVADVFGWYSG